MKTLNNFFNAFKYFLLVPFLFTGCAFAQTFTLPHDHSTIGRGGAIAPSAIDFSNISVLDLSNPESIFLGAGAYGTYFFVDDGAGSSAYVAMQGDPPLFTITDGTDTNVIDEESIVITRGDVANTYARFDVRGPGTPLLTVRSGDDYSQYQPLAFTLFDADFQTASLTPSNLQWIASSKDIIRLDAAANSPGIKLVEHDAAVNSQIWNMRATSGSFILTVENDAESSEVTAISVARSGTNIDSILLRSDSLSISNGTDNFQIDGAWYDTGSYSTTTLGCGTEVNVDVYYEKIGNIVHIDLEPQGSTCTSDATNFLIAGTSTPSNILPTEETPRVPVGPLVDNGATVFGALATFNNSGQITFYNASLLTTSWTASGSKGFTASDYRAGISFSYRIN